jgi:uncharacterized membrane protein YdcZ (DUF606 family)
LADGFDTRQFPQPLLHPISAAVIAPANTLSFGGFIRLEVVSILAQTAFANYKGRILVPTSAVFGYLLAFGAGVSFVFQQAVNANLRVEIGSPWWAGFVSYLGGTIVMLLMAAFLLQPWPSTQMIYRSHWLSWTGGVFGAIYIAISILLLPTLRAVQEAAPTMGLQIATILNATSIGEIDAAFATIAHERPDALFVAADGFLSSRREQFATLTTRDRIPAAYSNRDDVTAGGLMSYGTDLADMYHQVGVYTGKILKGAKPTDMPVLQSTKFEFVLNLKTAKDLGIDVPPAVLSIADEVIE